MALDLVLASEFVPSVVLAGFAPSEGLLLLIAGVLVDGAFAKGAPSEDVQVAPSEDAQLLAVELELGPLEQSASQSDSEESLSVLMHS